MCVCVWPTREEWAGYRRKQVVEREKDRDGSFNRNMLHFASGQHWVAVLVYNIKGKRLCVYLYALLNLEKYSTKLFIFNRRNMEKYLKLKKKIHCFSVKWPFISLSVPIYNASPRDS